MWDKKYLFEITEQHMTNLNNLSVRFLSLNKKWKISIYICFFGYDIYNDHNHIFLISMIQSNWYIIKSNLLLIIYFILRGEASVSLTGSILRTSVSRSALDENRIPF
jgi:hypothetical protein